MGFSSPCSTGAGWHSDIIPKEKQQTLSEPQSSSIKNNTSILTYKEQNFLQPAGLGEKKTQQNQGLVCVAADLSQCAGI